MFSFVCAECGCEEYTSKGFNSNKTKKRLVCKNCGKNVYVDLDVFDGATSAPVSSRTVNVGESITSANIAEVPPVKTVDLVNERNEDREPLVAKTRIISINGQTGAFPNFTERMVEQYAESQNHKLEFRDGVYYLTARPGSKG
jgi:DNA-directed RNA polymerase subunit RPC12/RpoP